MKKLYLFLTLIITAITLNAQPQGYYNGTEKTDLHHVYPTDGFVNG